MITIYGVPISVHVRKSVITAELKRIEYRIEPVIPFNPPANWDTVSPTGLIPVIDDDGFTLQDSTAICLYLERKRPAPAILPHNARAYARALWFNAYATDVIFRQVVHGLFFQKIIRPGIFEEATDQDAVAAVLETALPKAFKYLESQIDGPFLVGDALSLADIAVVSPLVNYQYLGFGIDEAVYPRLAGYTRAIIAHPVIQRVLANEQPFSEQMGLDRSFLRSPVNV